MNLKNYPLFTLLALVISGAIIFFLILPKYQSYSGIKKEVAARLAEFQSQEEYISRLRSTHERIENYQESLAKIQSAIPEKRLLPDLLSLFQETASQSGLIMEKVTPSFVASDLVKDIRVTRINLTLKGDYAGLKNFIKTIEKSARLIEVDSVYFRYPEKGTLFTFSLTLTVQSY